ncbi:hypothetical protein [Streptomyces sp. NPDC001876]|uniref:hypothetical protein n=1 Tax=Streptomyces sp. NPDC001876 TaxID=3154402 RepID=UPI0033299A51
MTETSSGFIPAAPGWYVHETDDDGESLDPILAWKAATTADGEDTLMPVVNGGVLVLPVVLDEGAFQHCGRSVVYRPNHDPAAGQ